MKWILLAVTLGVPLFLALARLRHVMARNRVRTRFEQFKEKVVRLRQQIEAIQQRHRFLTYTGDDYKEPLAGTTLTVYQQLDQDLEKLSGDWLRCMEVWEKVEPLTKDEHPLRAGRFNEAGRLLDDLGDFSEVDAACAACTQQLDRLETGHKEARERLAEAEEGVKRLRSQVESVGTLGLPTGPYEAGVEKCPPLIEQARQILSADPLGASDSLARVHQEIATLGEWMDDIVRLHGRAGKALDELEAIRRQTVSRRDGGLLLNEPEGNPDPLLAQSETERQEALECLHRAENRPAAEHLDRAFSLAGQAADVIERQAAARDECTREVPARRAEADRLRQTVAEARDHRGELERNFDPASWRDVAENPVHALELSRDAEALLEEAAEAADNSVQHYFRASRLLAQVRDQQEQAHALSRATAEQLRTLSELRRECSRVRQDIAELTHRAGSYLTRHEREVRPTARSRFDAANGAWGNAQRELDASRPNFPTARKQMEAARQEYAAALKEAEEDVRNHERLMGALGEAEDQAYRVDDLLRRHSEDRPQANQAYRRASEALQRIRDQSTDRGADWVRLLAQVKEATEELKKAEGLAREDLRLADQAEAAVADAGRELERTRGFYESGISADTGGAVGLLDEARRHLDNQAYEQAVAQAEAARKAARQAHEDAGRRAREKERRAEQERLAAAAGETPTEPRSGEPTS
jgi:hypothetical protein